MLDRLIIKGLPPLDGEYGFDIVSLLSPGDPAYLTYREWHRIKEISKVRAGEIGEAFEAGDTDVNLAIAVVVLTRHGRTVDIDALWDAPGTTEIRFVIADREASEEGDDEQLPPAQEPLANGVSGSPSAHGGTSSSPTLVSPENGQSPTGDLGIAISARATSAS